MTDLKDQVVVQNLVKDYSGLRAVDDLSFTVEAGEVLGFLGPNGAGKSTTMKMVTGFVPPTAGTAIICGHPIDTQPIPAKHCFGYLPEGAPGYGEMSPWQFLQFIASIRRLTNRRKRLDTIIGQLGLEPVLYRPIDTLSKGFRRRVGLAQAILHDPRVLIMDEPTDGLDPNQKRQVHEFINEMSQDKIIVVSTHILEEVDAMCTRAIIIAEGRLLADDTPEHLRHRSRYYNAITVQAELSASLQKELTELDALAVIEQDRFGGLILIPKPGGMLQEPVEQLLDRHGLTRVPRYVHPGRLDDVFHALTRKRP